MIRDGQLHQIGRPEELTAHPADEFVASLTGGNLLHGIADGTRVTLDDGTVIEVGEAGARAASAWPCTRGRSACHAHRPAPAT